MRTRTIRPFFLLALLLTITPCCVNTDDKPENYLESASYITGQVISENTEIFLEPSRMTYIPPYLIFSNPRGERLITVYDCKKDVILNNIGPRGMGPQELMMIGNIHNYDKNKRIALYDIIRKEIYSIDKDQLLSPNAEMIKEAAISMNASQAFLIDETGLHILNGPLHTGRFLMFHKGIIQSRYNDFPKIPVDVTDTTFLNMGFQNFSAISPNGKMLANIVPNSEILEGFSFENNHIKNTFSKHWSMKPFGLIQDGPVSGVSHSSQATGFKNLAVNDNHIYCVYSNVPLEDNKDLAAYGEFLFCFDWKGNVKKVYKLNWPLRTIVVSEDDGSLIGTTRINNEIRLVEYILD